MKIQIICLACVLVAFVVGAIIDCWLFKRFKKPAKPVTAPTNPPVPAHDVQRLEARVGLLAQDDPLWPMLIALVQQNLALETAAVARAAIGDEEAHRARGRVGMCLDLEQQLREVWERSHTAEPLTTEKTG